MINMTTDNEILDAHRINHGKIEMVPKVMLESKQDLSIHYTPGVAVVCNAIKNNKDLVYEYTNKGNLVGIISDGTRILGLGKIGPEAGLPVMEGKSVLFKRFGGVDAIPMCIGTTDEEEIIKFVENISPTLGGINIEDIESPKSFRIVDKLTEKLDIPVLHDDQQGTAMVILAGIINSLKLANKDIKKVKFVINGAGSAGMGVVRLLKYAGINNIIVIDTHGSIYKGRTEGMNEYKEEIADCTNPKKEKVDLKEAVKGADILIGLSKPNVFTEDLIKSMADKPIVFALANPVPEIDYETAKKAGAFIVATGRSDTPNQVNNLLGFPGIMRGLLDARAKKVTYSIIYNAALALADAVGDKLSVDYILPTLENHSESTKMFEKIAYAVAETAVNEDNSKIKDINLIKKEISRNMERNVNLHKNRII